MNINGSNELIALTFSGMMRYDKTTDRFIPYPAFGKFSADGSTKIYHIAKDSIGDYWVNIYDNNRWRVERFIKKQNGSWKRDTMPFKRLDYRKTYLTVPSANGIIWFTNESDGLLSCNTNKIKKTYNYDFNTLIRKVSIKNDSVVYWGAGYLSDYKNSLKLECSYNKIIFEYACPFFENPDKNQFSYFLENYDKKWSEWSNKTMKKYERLREGKYTFMVKSKNTYDIEGSTVVYKFEVLPPWYRTWWAYGLYLFLFVCFIWIVIKLNTRRLIKEKISLEKIITKRTIKIQTQNEELNQQKEEIQTQAEDLKSTNDKLLELDHFKEGMTGMIVHDLKNPLNLIINTPKTFSVEKQLSITKQSGKQMLNMVMNILDVSKYEESEMIVDKSNYSLYKLSQNAIDEVNFLSDKKSIIIENEISTQTGVQADKEIVERVFVNILTNAIKYTPNNGKISLQSTIDDKNNEYVKISICDTGQGIPKDKLNSVFDKFGQVAAKKSGNVRSTGLGLTFCKMAVEAHNGKISVESELEKGTNFIFTLPTGESFEKIKKVEKQVKTDSFILTEDDKIIINKYIAELKNLLVYETSEIEIIIEKINSNNSLSLQKWKDEMNEVIFTLNENDYIELLNKAKQ